MTFHPQFNASGEARLTKRPTETANTFSISRRRAISCDAPKRKNACDLHLPTQALAVPTGVSSANCFAIAGKTSQQPDRFRLAR